MCHVALTVRKDLPPILILSDCYFERPVKWGDPRRSDLVMGKDQKAIHRPSWAWGTSPLSHLLTSVQPELHHCGHTWKRRHSVLGIRKLEFKIQSCPQLSHFNSQSLISHEQNERSGLDSIWLFCGQM